MWGGYCRESDWIILLTKMKVFFFGFVFSLFVLRGAGKREPVGGKKKKSGKRERRDWASNLLCRGKCSWEQGRHLLSHAQPLELLNRSLLYLLKAEYVPHPKELSFIVCMHMHEHIRELAWRHDDILINQLIDWSLW